MPDTSDQLQQLRPWPPPQGGYERQLRSDWCSPRRRSLTRSDIRSIRLLIFLEAAFVVGVLAAGLGGALEGVAIGCAVGGLIGLVTSCWRQLRQILGLGRR